MKIFVFTMSYDDLRAIKGECCEVLETILDIIPDPPSVSKQIMVRFQKPEGIVFGAQTIIYDRCEVKVKQISRFDIPEGLSHQQWVELIALDLRAHLRVAGLRCVHKTIMGDTPGDWDLIFTPR